MTKKELQERIDELEAENGKLAREAMDITRESHTRATNIEVVVGELRRQVEEKDIRIRNLQTDLDDKRNECAKLKNKCNQCGLYQQVEGMKETIGLQEVTLERWYKLEKMLNDAGWDCEFGRMSEE